MTQARTPLPSMAGIWVPLITPFHDGKLDEQSLRSLAQHYLKTGITGFVLAGTTGEALTIDEEETARLVEVVQEENTPKVPVILGLCGSNTAKLVKTVTQRNGWDIDGYLITAPYYTRPTQEGLYRHYTALADASAFPVALYNIPYRTSVNVENETVFRLAEHPRIIAIKDCCANAAQAEDLIKRAPKGFSVLVGDDANFFNNVSLGAQGGILASAHIGADIFVQVLTLLKQGETERAKAIWDRFVPSIPYLFKYPNPGPLKHILTSRGIIKSAEVRLPLIPIPAAYGQELDAAFPCVGA